jgi:hypothetical protein
VSWRFPIFIAVSYVLFIAILRIALIGRSRAPDARTTSWVAMIVVVAGMLFAKAGAAIGLPPPVFYGIPALVTWILPPRVFHMSVREIAIYIPLAMLMAPAIHVFFAYFFGWTEYMPFIPIEARFRG